MTSGVNDWFGDVGLWNNGRSSGWHWSTLGYRLPSFVGVGGRIDIEIHFELGIEVTIINKGIALGNGV